MKTVWTQSGLQQRATVIKEYVHPLSTSAGLEFDIQADNVLCSDEGTYRCKVSGTSSINQPIEIDIIGTVQFKVEATINQIQVSPKPEMEASYRPNTLIELSCTGTVGRNHVGVLRWCYRRGDMFNFNGWPNAEDYDQGMLVQLGCQNSQTSTLRYNVSADYRYTEFRCESGDSFLPCGFSKTIASNITIYRYSVPIQSTTLTSVETTDTVSLPSTSLKSVEIRVPIQSTSLTSVETTDLVSLQSTSITTAETRDSVSQQSTSLTSAKTKDSASGDRTS